MNVMCVVTPPGQGGIAVVRLLGTSAEEVFSPFFSRRGRPGSSSTRIQGRLSYGKILDGDRVVDEVVVCRRSREDIDICLHGGVVPVDRFRELMSRSGVEEVALPVFRLHLWRSQGYHSLRAEAAAALSFAGGVEAVRLLARPRSDAFELAVRKRIRQVVRAMRETGDVRPEWGEELQNWEDRLARSRRILLSRKVVLTGATNGGKSTLFNALSGLDRVVVSPEPGTTRDAIEWGVDWNGFHLHLVDTAGHGEPRSQPDQLALRRTREEVQSADVIVAVFDGAGPSRSMDPGFLDSAAKIPLVEVVSKSDLESHRGVLKERQKRGRSPVSVSSHTGEGLSDLIARVLEAGDLVSPQAGEKENSVEPWPISARQSRELSRARGAFASGSLSGLLGSFRALLQGVPDFQDPIFCPRGALFSERET